MLNVAHRAVEMVAAIEELSLYHFHPGGRALCVDGARTNSDDVVADAVRMDARAVAAPVGFVKMGELASACGHREVLLVSSCHGRELAENLARLEHCDAVVVDVSGVEMEGGEEVARTLDAIAELALDDVWVELTRSVARDSHGDRELNDFTRAIVARLGPDVPLHLRNLEDARSNERAGHERWIALANGMHWVYGGAIGGRSSWCPGCDARLATRGDGDPTPLENECVRCGWLVPGRFGLVRRSYTQLRPAERGSPVRAPSWEHLLYGDQPAVRGRGNTMAEAMERTALALVAWATNPARVEPLEVVRFEYESPRPELLLVAFLDGVAQQMRSSRRVFTRFAVEVSGHHLVARAWGERVDDARHRPAVRVQRAVPSSSQVRRLPNGQWVALCGVDLSDGEPGVPMPE